MSSVAVVANSSKSLGGGLPELRRILEREGIANPIWHEVAKSRDAPECVRLAIEAGADLVFVWGGDGMVQRCVGAIHTRRQRWQSCRPVLQTSSQRTSRSRTTFKEQSRMVFGGVTRSSTSDV